MFERIKRIEFKFNEFKIYHLLLEELTVQGV